MRDAVGGSLLLNIVVIFTSIVILFFAGIMAYSKAYKIKNRIIEVIEKNEKYDVGVHDIIYGDLKRSGYLFATSDQVDEKCGDANLNKFEYLYCVYLKSCDEKDATGNCVGQRHYEVVTYIHFDVPVIGDMLTFEVKGETKMLGKNYNY